MAENDDAELELEELREQAMTLEEEVAFLRRKLQDAPKRVRTLEERLLETKGQLAQAVSQNEKLTYTLREAREHIAALREEVEKLTQPPSADGTLLDDGLAYVKDGDKVLSDPGGAEGIAPIPDGQLDAVIESAEECPGECIFIEPE